MNRTKLSVYLLIPVAVSTVLIAMYFSGSIVLQRLVSPKLPPLSPDAWREFGILENLQNLLLLGIVAIACVGVVKKTQKMERVALALLVLFAGFVFLEEIDYGVHFAAYLNADEDFNWFQPMRAWPIEMLAKTDLSSVPFNLHNIGGLNRYIKKTVDTLIVLLFVLAPFIAPRFKNPWARYLAPDKYVVFTVLAMVILRFITHELGDWEEGVVEAAQAAGQSIARERGSISSNLSEFRELNTYYLFALYLANLVFFRSFSATACEEAEPGEA